MFNSPLEFLVEKYGNVIKYDAAGNPSIYVPFYKCKSSDLDPSLPDHTHPAFRVNGQDLDRILIGKYMASELTANGTLYSLPNMPVKDTIPADAFQTRMRAFGGGASGKTVAMSGLILLLAKKHGWNPQGNNSYGFDYRQGTRYVLAQPVAVGGVRVFRGWAYKCLIAHTTAAELLPDRTPAYWQRQGQVGGTMNPAYIDRANTNYNGYTTLTGTGPLSWYLDGTPGSICDIVGNSLELDYGYRLRNCELQILEDNNAASPTADLSLNSAAWKAILPNTNDDGYTLVSPGTAGTLYWTWANSTLTLDTVKPEYDGIERAALFKDLAVNTANVPFVPHILRELGLFPISGDATDGRVYVIFTEDERLPRRGGGYNSASFAGLGYTHASDIRSGAGAYTVARPAYVEL